MLKWMKAASLSALALALGVTSVAPAYADTDPQVLVDKAHATIEDLKRDKEFGDARDLIRQAQAVVIIPSLIKGGFMFGGEGGSGVLLARTQGTWTEPAFYSMFSGSFGLQIGVENAEVVMIIMTRRGIKSFMQNQFKIGAQAGLAVATLGSTAEASTSGLRPDIIVWSSASGLYGGLTVNGSKISAEDGLNQEYYNQPISALGIVAGKVYNPGAEALRHELDRLN